MSYQTNASFDSDDRHLLLNGSLASWLTLWRTWANFKPSVTQDFPPVGSKDLTYRNFSSDHDCFALRQALVDDERIENLSKDGIVSNFSNQEAVDIDTELNKSNLPPTLDCPIKLFDTAVYSPTNVDCSLKADNWVHTDADSNLATFVRGGVSTEGEFFTGLEPNKSLATELRTIMSVTGGLRCSLKNPCGPPQACTDLGVRYTYSPPGALHTSKFGYLALWAIRNINQQLNNQYVAIKGAAIRGTLDTFNVDTYLPKPSKPTGLLDALNGIGAIVAVISGFLPPVAGAITGAVGAIVPAAGAVFERSISDNVKKYGPLAAQKEFAPILRRIYEDFVETLDTVTTDLFDGKKINNQTTILDMMSGGHWVDPDTLTDVSDAEDQIYTEIFSRAINGLWKIPTSNKIWVLYLDTGDRKNSIDKCEAHTAGPQDLKYCADGGVYYAYNFIEDGDYKGHLGYPWGADQMDLNTHINPAWIVEGSARSYQLAKTASNQLDPFHFNSTIAIESLLASHDGPNLRTLTGRFPGSWTLPVCNASTWGGDWTVDYTKLKSTNHVDQHPPCICGEGGKETSAWVEAAGLKHFQTFYTRCRDLLESPDGSQDWPPGVTQISYGFGDIIQKWES